jgi:penicillin-insensitive murein DD-endopeptidase
VVLSRTGGLVLWSLALSGCLGVFSGDGSSVSLGSHSKGALARSAAMPFEGSGYLVHRDWRARGHRYATEEMVRWLTDVFADVNRADPESVAYLGDLSARQGGDAAEHRSHASGRDVDVFLMATDAGGQPLHDLPAMLHFGSDGRAVGWSPERNRHRIRERLPEAYFDVRRNWAIVRAMLENPTTEVQWIFLHEPLAALLIAEGERAGDRRAILDKARAVLHQPTDSQPHDDHMHVRVFCAPSDRSSGCTDKGPKRWLKKHWKYMSDRGATADRRS